MIKYRIDVIKALLDAGYTTYRIRKERLLPSSAMKSLAEWKPVSFDTLDALCVLLKCDVGDILFHSVEQRTRTREREGAEIADDLAEIANRYRNRE